MIKTIPYNDFTAYGWQERQDHEFMFQEMKNFVDAGGDLSYAVMGEDNKLINFADYIKSRFDVAFMDRLMDNGLVQSPFSFILKKSEKYITEDKKYGLRWMNSNFKEFDKQIISSIKEIAKKIDGVEITHYSQVDYSGDYQNHKKTHPLYHIASQLENNTEVWETILENNKEIHIYMKEFLKKKEHFEGLFNATWEIRNPELANLFYKHNLIDDYFKKNNKSIYDMVSSAIYHNELEVFDKLSKNFDLIEIEKEKNIYEVFLRKVRTPEMAEAVLKVGCFSVGKWKGKEKTNETSYALDEHMDGDTISAIVNYIDKNLVSEHHLYFYNLFIKERANLDTVKVLVEKHNFPVEKYDMLQVGQKISHHFSSFESVKWLLEHGADPRNCKEFVDTLIAQREDGKKALGLYKREGLLDTFSADMIYAMSNSQDMKKIFITYYDKVTSEQLARTTKSGEPAWFGVNSQEFFTLIKNKIENYNQLSSKGDAWVNSLFHHRIKSKDSASTTISWLDKAKENIIKNGGTKISGAVSPENNKNFLHSLLYLSEYGKTDSDTELVKYVFENVEADFVKLINQKDNNGKYPLHNFFFYDDGKRNEKTQWNNKNTLVFLAKTLGKDFPFEQEINGQKVIELLEKYDSNLFREAYLGYRAEKLSQMLPEKNDKTRGIKI